MTTRKTDSNRVELSLRTASPSDAWRPIRVTRKPSFDVRYSSEIVDMGVLELVEYRQVRERDEDGKPFITTKEFVRARGSRFDLIQALLPLGVYEQVSAVHAKWLCECEPAPLETNALRFGWQPARDVQALCEGKHYFAKLADPKDGAALLAAYKKLPERWRDASPEEKDAFKAVANRTKVIISRPTVDVERLEGTDWDPSPYLND